MKIQTLASLVKLWHDLGNELSYELGAEICGLRNRLGWTQEEAAKESELPLKVYQSLELSDITINKDLYLAVIFMMDTAAETK